MKYLEVNNNLNVWVERRLGIEWMTSNGAYVKRLFRAVQERGTSEGVFEAKPDGDRRSG